MLKNFEGVNKKQNQFHFLNYKDLLEHFIKQYYGNKCIAILMDSRLSFSTVPKLNVLKRDNLTAYMLGITNDFALIEFESLADALDYLYSLPPTIEYLVYDYGKLIRNEKGIIK